MSTVVFHEGELALQERAGSRDRLAESAPQSIRPALSVKHQSFFARLPFVILAAVDATNQVWATLIAGPPGFISAPDAEHLSVRTPLSIGDPLADCLVPGAKVGLLGIEAHTPRRNRANGHIVLAGDTGFDLRVDQSFSNCPKYIRQRRAEFLPGMVSAARASHLRRLNETARQMIRQADTFFIASAHPQAGSDSGRHQGVDVSHRGGTAGFVDLADDDTLTLPDYVGNAYFNTLGNLLLNPRAGLLFIDFDTGRMLWLAAEAEIVHDGPDLARLPAAERLLRLKIREARFSPGPLPLRWVTLPPAVP